MQIKKKYIKKKKSSNRPTVQTHAVVNLYQVVHLFVLTDCSLSFS